LAKLSLKVSPRAKLNKSFLLWFFRLFLLLHTKQNKKTQKKGGWTRKIFLRAERPKQIILPKTKD
jgi:hypothetical protein